MSQGYLYDTGDEIIERKAHAGGVIAHLANEPIELEIGGQTYDAYPLDKSFREMTENVSVMIDEQDGYSVVCYLSTISTESERYEGFPFYMSFYHPENETTAFYAETADSTPYLLVNYE